VAVVYLDTSALGRLLLGEPDTPAILRELGGFDHRVASRLLAVELRRLALRENLGTDADRLLADVSLLPIDEGLLSAAEVLAPAAVATLDAIHLATAIRLASALRLDALMTYDQRLADGARHHGLTVLAPY
jgi:predicted nucleic acid-binding protein